jgi:hypothetical protein
MPAEVDRLLPEEVEIFRKWIEQRDPWYEH